MSDLSGSTALITGASSGIGEAVSCRFAAGGASVILVARREDRLGRLADQLGSQAPHAEVLAADLSTPGGRELVAEYLRQRPEPVNVLVNAAGIQVTLPLTAGSDEDWRPMIELNLVAPMVLSTAFAKRLRRSRCRGLVLNIASTAAFRPTPGAAAYGATKAALVAFGGSAAQEWAGSGVRVITICPGLVQTKMLEQVSSTLGTDGLQKLTDAVPLGLGSPRQVAELAASLAGVAGEWMTGTSVVIDGGYSGV